MQEVLRHLIHGWQGFIGILAKATNEGVVIQKSDLERLERMQAELGVVINNQKALKAQDTPCSHTTPQPAPSAPAP